MAFQADSSQLAGRARRLYTDELVKGLTALVRRVVEIAHAAQDKPADHHTRQRRRDLAQALAAQGLLEDATRLYERIGGPPNFYGNLADEELGRAIVVPPQNTPRMPAS